MKKKIIKQLFAAVIAISVFATTPGFVSAVKRRNDKAKESQTASNSKKEARKAGSNQKKSKAKKDVRFVPKNKENEMAEESKKADETGNADVLLDRPLKNACDKQNLIQEISNLISKEPIDGNSREKIVAAIFKLCEFVNDAEVADDAIYVLNEWICSGRWENLCSKDEILKIIWGLSSCVGNEEIEASAAESINNLTVNSAWANKCSKPEIFKIFDVLNGFVLKGSDKNSLKYVVCALSNLMFDSEFVRGCYAELMPQIFGMLFMCVDVDDVREDVACFVGSLAKFDIFCEFFKRNARYVIELLESCRNNESAHFVSNAVLSLLRKGVFSSLGEDMSRMIGVLNLCISDNSLDEKKNFVSAIFYLCKSNLFELIREKEVADIVNLLLSFLEDRDLKLRESAARVLSLFLRRGFFSEHPKQYIFKIINSFFKFALDCADFKKELSSFILHCVKRNLFFANAKDETKNLLDILVVCAEREDAAASSKQAFLIFKAKGLMKDFSEDEILKYDEQFSKFASE